jgi:hypothetical protein
VDRSGRMPRPHKAVIAFTGVLAGELTLGVVAGPACACGREESALSVWLDAMSGDADEPAAPPAFAAATEEEVVREGKRFCVRTAPLDAANGGSEITITTGSCADLPPAGGESTKTQGDR